ncbi:hypothetical protein [Spelaeicoccus albus]|uniref:Uncharacterized protein n=1 Tax=Spelaeicoccus albus TaxID=1280376 RepID=A0A7Z0AA68_9MICO|nr:hypothetical protein [Spelaeicoccus albus]NYI66390.1 hypothetical protein [Spelaeicoccus albus]
MSNDGSDDLRAKSRRWHGYSHDVHRAAVHARRTGTVDWESEAAGAFRRRLRAVAADIDRCADDASEAAGALAAYARAIEARREGA